MHMLRLYLPSIVLIVWAILIVAADNGVGLTVIGLVSVAAAVFIHIRESHDRTHA